MGYKRGHESESLAEISRALRAGLQADAQASTPLSQHVQPEEPALAAPASKRKRKKPAAESARTGDPAKEAVKVKIAKKNRPPSAALDAALPGVTVEAARDLNDASIGAPEALQAPAQLTFRDVYVRGFTDAHAADLEALRQTEGESLRLDLLQRCIEAGMDVFTDVERRLCVQDALHHAGGRAAPQRPPGSMVHPWL